MGKTIADLIPPEDLPRLAASKDFLSSPEHVQVARWTLRAKGGGYVPVEVSAKIHADGRWVAFVRDITERLRAEDALRRSEESLARAQRAANVGSWDWDLATNTVTRSDELLRLFGLPPGGASAERGSLDSFIHPDDRERVWQTVDDAVRDGRSYALENRITRADGEERIVWQQGDSIVEDGKTVRMVGTLRDVTERRRAELELERLRAEWSSVVAHDLRQPLNTILLYATMAKRAREASEGAAAIDHIVSAARTLDRMIGDLMDLSRLEARRLQLSRERVDVRDAARACVEQVALAAPDRAVEVRTTGGPWTVDADPMRLAQIVDNLLTNAIKYGAPGTPIVVSIDGAPSGVTVSVGNRGSGISTEQLPHLFQRFARPSDARASKIQGTGLGLYIVRELVEAHGGTISAESTPGETTTFRFTLPAAR